MNISSYELQSNCLPLLQNVPLQIPTPKKQNKEEINKKIKLIVYIISHAHDIYIYIHSPKEI